VQARAYRTRTTKRRRSPRRDLDGHNDNIMQTRGHSTARIDGIVAAIIGLSRAMFQEPVRRSVYETRGPIELEW
jgi:hypothetical protein